MKLVRSKDRPDREADPRTFSGPALVQPLLGRGDGAGVRLYRVAFEPGVRMSWHRHDGAQILVGLSGRCVVGNRAGEEVELTERDVVVVEPHEEHWHGAAAEAPGAHLAINLGGETVWLEPVV